MVCCKYESSNFESSSYLRWWDPFLEWVAPWPYFTSVISSNLTQINSNLECICYVCLNNTNYHCLKEDPIIYYGFIENPWMTTSRWGWWWLIFYGHFWAPDRLNGPSDVQMQWNEVKDETPFRYADAEIRTQVVVICGPTRYQLDHGDTTRVVERSRVKTNRLVNSSKRLLSGDRSLTA